jgi:steroid delta-isomerase-like uncharacterized protein
MKRVAQTRKVLTILIPLAMLLSGNGYAQSKKINSTQTENIMTTTTLTERNKEVLEVIMNRAFNERKFELLKELVSDEYVGLNGLRGAEAFQAPILQLIKGFPDAQWNIQQIIADDRSVFVSWKLEGTHSGTWLNIPATGKKVSGAAMGVYELKDGKVVKGQVITDRLGFLQALGVIPADVSTLVK